MKEYLKAQTKTNETILRNSFSSDELDRFSRADFRWAENRATTFSYFLFIARRAAPTHTAART